MKEAKSLLKKDGCVSAAIPNMVSGAKFSLLLSQVAAKSGWRQDFFFFNHTHIAVGGERSLQLSVMR